MSKIKTSDKFNEVQSALATLSGVHSIQEIIDCIRGIENFKTKNGIKGFDKSAEDCYGTTFEPASHELFSNIYVDITYQRRIRLQKILNMIKNGKGYNTSAAGYVDVAQRADGFWYVFDGLRRCIMAGLCGSKWITVSRFVHQQGCSVTEAQMVEAELFWMKNTLVEKMKPEEIFKSKVVFKDAAAVDLLRILVNAELDVENLNPNGTQLGGFKLLEDSVHNKITEDYVVESSRMIRKVWSSPPNVTVYLLCGLSKFLEINDELDDAKDYSQIEDDLIKHVSLKPTKTQGDFTKSRLNAKPIESIAYYIAKNVIDSNGNKKEYVGKVIDKLNLTDDDIDTVEDLR